jgi:hypothetical protein
VIIFLFISTGPAGVHLDHLVLITSLKESVGLDQFQQGSGMRGVARNHEEERFDDRIIALPCIGLELYLHALVQAHAVLQLQTLHLVRRQTSRVEVLARNHRRLFHEAVGHGAAQWVVINDVRKRHRTLAGFHERCGRQLQPQDRFQLVDGPYSGAGVIAVRLIHQQHQIRKPSQVIEVALADVL